MYFENKELLRHILDEIEFVLFHTNGKSQNTVFNDAVLSRAIIRSLEVIGEASKKIEPDFKTIHPHISWKEIAGTRDKLIHDYFGVDYDIVWDIIVNNLPDLKIQIREVLE
ncbi:MAG TPA: DUF86 domain-containing protein [Bacteroidia bacterium]|nr:DUF86 domain-containing protein [Bacteroidia bacterium]QQR95390.1 MAG: DUF86 domain-containing protein [Bacteroidota bacterium]MBP7715124.1 DUF86 domain-containing protein [Bacteroidia bacterium]HOZ89672.1 DUF86 domain-containing protein [Bacteroidia bacterium]HQW17941.1 DUF86 domain-containing protein [Bacteroidia bacterium]